MRIAFPGFPCYSRVVAVGMASSPLEKLIYEIQTKKLAWYPAARKEWSNAIYNVSDSVLGRLPRSTA